MFAEPDPGPTTAEDSIAALGLLITELRADLEAQRSPVRELSARVDTLQAEARDLRSRPASGGSGGGGGRSPAIHLHYAGLRALLQPFD